MNSDIGNLPTAWGAPLFKAVQKQTAADFKVDESLAISFSGDGEHLYLQLEKTAMNTDEVASLLQQAYNVQSADIGMCGLKDRHSIATQWFSVKTPLSADLFEDAAALFNEHQQVKWQGTGGYIKQLRMISNARHLRKLRRGAHSGNQFCIVLHDVLVEDCTNLPVLVETVSQRLSLINDRGFPAYIGAQRFGQGGQNLHRAKQWFARSRKRITRQQRSLYLSVARSHLFNEVLASRVRDGHWDQLLSGEPVMLSGSRSFFHPDAEALSAQLSGRSSGQSIGRSSGQSLDARLREFDIHPSAPWWGRGHTLASGDCADHEAQTLSKHSELCTALEHAGLTQERRAIRAQPVDLEHHWRQDNVLELRFSLSPGVFATTLLRELCTVTEPQR